MVMTSLQRRQWHERIEVQVVGDHVGSRRHGELAAFVHYCIARIERDLGEVGHWEVRVTPCLAGFSSIVSVDDGWRRAEATAEGFDGPLAIWDVMCRLEQTLRETRGRYRRRAVDDA
jgi:hypothetical protein